MIQARIAHRAGSLIRITLGFQRTPSRAERAGAERKRTAAAYRLAAEITMLEEMPGHALAVEALDGVIEIELLDGVTAEQEAAMIDGARHALSALGDIAFNRTAKIDEKLPTRSR